MTDKEICPDKHVYARIQHYYQHLKDRQDFFASCGSINSVEADVYTKVEIESLIDRLEKIFPDIIYKA